MVPLKKAVAYYLRLALILRNRVLHEKNVNSTVLETNARLSVQEIEAAELAILKFEQLRQYEAEYAALKRTKDDESRGRATVVSRCSSIYRLDPFLDGDLIRVGGRLTHSTVP